MVDDLGFTPEEVLTATTVNTARVLREHGEVVTLVASKLADFIVVKGDPAADVGVLMESGAIEAVYLGGWGIALDPPTTAPRHPWERSHRQWGEVYSRDRLARLRAAARLVLITPNFKVPTSAQGLEFRRSPGTRPGRHHDRGGARPDARSSR